MKKTLVMSLICLVIFTLGSALAQEEVSFVAFGHVYTSYADLHAAVEKVNALDPDFIVFLGDTLQEPTMPLEELQILVQRFKAPVYFVAGNHDIDEGGDFGRGGFVGDLVEELYYAFELKGYEFIALNSVTGKETEYGISEEQRVFLRNYYGNGEKNKVIFMHHCLFANAANLFCNSRPYYEANGWAEHTNEFTEETLAVFVGDVGIHESYFAYQENGIEYYGVGFSPNEKKFAYPRHFLYVTLDQENIQVRPVLIRDDLSTYFYQGKVPETLQEKTKSYIKKNLALTFNILFLVITLLFITVFWVYYKYRQQLKR